MKCLDTGDKLALLSSALAIAISKELSNDDISVLASFLTAIGDNLAVIAAQRQAYGTHAKTAPQNKPELDK